MESWRRVWREGAAPLLTLRQLECLACGLREDDPALIQRATTDPPPLMSVQDWPCEAGCLVAYPFLREATEDDDQVTVQEVGEFFARACHNIDKTLGEPAACRYLLNWFDEAPRGEVLAHLLPEVEDEIARRKMVP